MIYYNENDYCDEEYSGCPERNNCSFKNNVEKQNQLLEDLLME